jgi:heme A synthase
MAPSGLRRFAWSTLAFNVAVILWGAYVRASGSGAGCGEHWPTCNGEVIPRDPSVKTLIEFTHRATSGVALIMVVALWWWTLRATERTHPARRAAWATLGFMLSEAAVGAALVLFRLVADNESMARAMFMSVHLVNTFLLLASMVMTAWWLQGGAPVPGWPGGPRGLWLAGTVLLVLVLGVSGAITALGDTLYPVRSLQEGLAQDLSTTTSIFVRLRLFHPVIAFAAGLSLVACAWVLPSAQDATGRRVARALMVMVGAQLCAGLVNVALLAPVWMQLVHLLLADGVWLLLVLFIACVASQRDAPAPVT